MPRSFPHSQAAFINSIREEGTKQEACDWLQSTWNELVALRTAARPLHERYLGTAALADATGAESVAVDVAALEALSKAYTGGA